MASSDNGQLLDTDKKHEKTESTMEEIVFKKSLRRFDKNEGKWSTLKPTAKTIRAESSKAMTIRDLHLSDNRKSFTLRSNVSNEKQLTKSTGRKSIHKVEPGMQQKKTSWRNKFADFVDLMKDEFRRLIRPENYDPYVKVTLKPTVAHNENSFQTSVIYGGGSNVAWNEFADGNQFTFLLYNEEDALKTKYLKIEVFDYESGSADQCLGLAYITTKGLEVGDKNYAELDLYETTFESGYACYAWAGTVEISATFKKLSLFEVELLKEQITEDIERKTAEANANMNDPPEMKSSRIKRKRDRARSRGMTDRLVMGRIGSRGITVEDNAFKSQRHLQMIEEDTQKHQEESDSVNAIRGRITLLVLFTSLILSGTMFFGAMDLYEVELQRIFYEMNYQTKFSLIDSLHWSLATASTAGYGDLYPQTTGGRIFGAFFIIFGVSLLGRLLDFVIQYEDDKFEVEMRLRATFRKSMTWNQMVEWDVDGDGSISKYEFLRGMLLRREDTTEAFINQIMDIFDEYDEDGSGEIEMDEMRTIMAKKTKEMQQKIEEEKIAKNKKDKYWDFWCCKIKKRSNDTENKQSECKEEESNENIEDILNDDEKNGNEIVEKDDFYGFGKDEPFEYGLHIEVHGCDNLKEEHGEFEDSLKTFLKSIVGFILWLIIAASIFTWVEGANFGDMLWFCVVTACTVGYGDQHPASSIGRVINAFFIGISVILFISFFSTAFDFIYKRQEVLVNQKQKAKNETTEMMDNFHFQTLKDALEKREENEKENKKKGRNIQMKKVPKMKNRLKLILNDDYMREDSDENHQALWDALNPPPEKKVDLSKLNAQKSCKNFGLSIEVNERYDDDDDDESMLLYIGSVTLDDNKNDTPTLKINQNMDVVSLGSHSDETKIEQDNFEQEKMNAVKLHSTDSQEIVEENDEATRLLVTTMENVMYENNESTKGFGPVQTNDDENGYMD